MKKTKTKKNNEKKDFLMIHHKHAASRRESSYVKVLESPVGNEGETTEAREETG